MKKLLNEKGEVIKSFSGNDGTIYTLDLKLDVKKYVKYQQLSLSFAYGLSFQQLYENIGKAMTLANGVPLQKNTFTDLVLHLNGIQESILNSNQTKYDLSFYLLTLFLKYDGMPSTWSEETADVIIENLDDYDASEVFFLISHVVTEYRKIVLELNGSIQTQMEDMQRIQSTGSGD